MAACFVALGHFSLAIKAYERALRSRPTDSALWAGLSAAYFGGGDLDNAVSAADKGLAVGLQTTSLLNNKRQALSAANRKDEQFLVSNWRSR